MSRVFLATPYYPRKYHPGQASRHPRQRAARGLPNSIRSPLIRGRRETPKRDKACDCKVDLHENFIHPTRDQSSRFARSRVHSCCAHPWRSRPRLQGQATTPWYDQEVQRLTLPALAATYPGRFSANPDLRSSHLTTRRRRAVGLGSAVRAGIAAGTDRLSSPGLCPSRAPTKSKARRS